MVLAVDVDIHGAYFFLEPYGSATAPTRATHEVPVVCEAFLKRANVLEFRSLCFFKAFLK